ncbi:MAG: BPSS1780 family membrane protein [Pseudomonadota bacterium]
MAENTPQNPNPFAAPTVGVPQAQPNTPQENFIAGGRSTNTGQGATWVARGWVLFTQAPLIWIVSVVIFFAIYLVLNFVPIIGMFVSYALYGLLAGGLMLGAHGQHNGRPLEVTDIFSGFKAPHATPLLIVGVLYMAAWIVLMVVAGILFAMVLGASGGIGALMDGGGGAITGLLAGAGLGALLVVLVVMSAAVPIFMAFWFAPILVAVNGIAPIEALKMSFSACLKNFLPFLIYGLIFLILFIIGSIPLGLGLLVVIPLMYTSTYAAYRDIFLGDGGN